MSWRFVVRRLLQAIPTIAVVLALGFLLVHLAPGDPVLVLAGEHGDAEYYRFMRHRFGLDRPLPVQFAAFVVRLAHGDLGYSYVYGRDTTAVILERVPATLLLTGTSLALALTVSIPLGTLAALHPHGRRDTGISVLALTLHSTPVFWLGQLAILVFAVHLHLLPVQGMTSAVLSGRGLHAADVLRHLALPALVLAAQEIAVLTRLTRAAMLDVLPLDHVRTARAKGASAARTVVRHALPRALLPLVSVVGTRVGHLVAGAAVVEIVFGWPGIGRLLLASLQSRDAPILLALFLLVSGAIVVSNLISDILHARLDPRIRVR